VNKEDIIKAEMRIWALECLVCQLWALVYQLLPPDAPALTQKAWIDGARQQTFPGADAVTSDLYSAEFESALSRLAEMQNSYLATVRKGSQRKP